MIWSPDRYAAAWSFAARAHLGQTVPGTELPYIVHVGKVAMEVMAAVAARGDVAQPDLAVQCALLHDVVEDTAVTVAELAQRFGADVAAGVSALTKDGSAGPKGEQMKDSLARIQRQPPEVWMVKLADRVTNLEPPPRHWDADKIARYREEARAIHAALAPACPVLAARLAARIQAYPAT